MQTPPSSAARLRWTWRLAVALVVAYAAWLRLVILFDKYGPFDHPQWLVTLEQTVAAPRPWLAPVTWRYDKIDQPYVGGDPINYIKFAREMRGFYQATIREPGFLEITRFFLKITDQDVGVSFSSLTFSVLCVFGTYLLGRAAVSRGAGLAAALALGIEQEFAAWAPDGWRDEAFAAFVILTAWAFLRAKQRPAWTTAIAAGVLAAAACLTRITSLTFVIPGLIWLAWPRKRPITWADSRQAGIASGVFAILLAPYLINCEIVTGDPLIAIDYHTRFYQSAEHVTTETPPTAFQYVAGKLRARPIKEIDTAVRGLVAYPFEIKWRGFVAWRVPGLGRVLEALAFLGLLLWIWQPTGRFLLLILFSSLAPYMLTWTLQGGGEWRFTMHAYAFYLVAAFAALDATVKAVRALVADRATSMARWRERRVIWKTAATALLIAAGSVASHWSPYFVAREALLDGDSTSIEAGDNDSVFFHDGWTGLVHAGAVISRFATTERATLMVPFPERRAYHLVIRMDPVPDTAVPSQRVRIVIDGRDSGTFELTWNPERVGAYALELPADAVRPGRATLEFVAEHASVVGQAATMFPELAELKSVAFRLWYVRLTPQ
jgi:hypothetical protein